MLKKINKEHYDQSVLFCRRGYIPLLEYLADIRHMDRYGPWKIPLRFSDRMQLGLLKLLAKLSWFAPSLYIMHPSSASPSYALIISYLRRHGIVHSVGERESTIPGCFSYVATTRVSTLWRSGRITGQGTSGDRATALSKALGEIIERLISGVHDTNHTVEIESPNTLIGRGENIMYPPLFHRYLDVQKAKYKSLLHDPGIPIEWVFGENLVTQERVRIPKKLTSWYIANGRRENMLAQATTNGAAGYFTKNGAVLRGLLEVVQRDGFLTHWLTMATPDVITNTSLPAHLREQVKKLESQGLSIYILDVTSLSIPAVIVAAVSEQSAEGPQVVLSGSAALTFGEAIGAALNEIVNGLEMFQYPDIVSLGGIERGEPAPFVSKLGKIERQLYWRGAERVDRFRWFVSGTRVEYGKVARQDLLSATSRDTDRLMKCIEVLKGRGYDYYPAVYFPKHGIQRELGFYVAQVFIPKAFPLYLVEYMGTFDSDRLDEFAQSKGVSEWKLNPYPHMFS